MALTLEDAVKNVTKGIRELSNLGDEFFKKQSEFYADMQHLVKTLSGPMVKATLSNKHRKMLADFLKPYQGLIQQPDFFNLEKPSRGYLKAIADIVRPDHPFFPQTLPHFKKCSNAKPKFNTFMMKLERQHPGLYQFLSNQLSGQPHGSVYVSTDIPSALIKPVQHITRCNLLLEEMLTKIQKILEAIQCVLAMMEKSKDINLNKKSKRYFNLKVERGQLFTKFITLKRSQRFIAEVCTDINSSQKVKTNYSSASLFKAKSAPVLNIEQHDAIEVSAPVLRKAYSSPV